MNYTITGLVLQAIAETSEALRLTLTQLLMQDKDGLSPFENLYYVCPVACISQVTVAMYTESQALQDAKSEHVKWFCVAAALGLGLNFISAVVIKLTSGLTLKVLSIIRNALFVLVMAGVGIETVSPLSMCGYALSLAFFACYALFAEFAPTVQKSNIKYSELSTEAKESADARVEATELGKSERKSAAFE